MNTAHQLAGRFEKASKNSSIHRLRLGAQPVFESGVDLQAATWARGAHSTSLGGLPQKSFGNTKFDQERVTRFSC